MLLKSVTNKPWVLNPTNPADAATTGDNIRVLVQGIQGIRQYCVTDTASACYGKL
jgi:hypothetical protein